MMDLFSLSMRKLWKEWNLRMAVLLSLTLQIVQITFDIYEEEGGSMNANTELIAFWAPFLLLHLGGLDSITDYALEDNELWLWHKANVIVAFALGIITNNVPDIYEEEGGSMNANSELTAFWAPFLLLHLGGPDSITAYALEDNELWLRHFLGLAASSCMEKELGCS
ncbi:hypothetical protein EZV62_003611 [Acer yangbiense]|uniref:DUF4220 domain-containing protein n=1 Tax=Acer yangbiense TaxID=1000413 RepID=A0A5C7IJQ4_9ROSI|nr:hypothetical protein EZV62_003611 [Acer yangbiense]